MAEAGRNPCLCSWVSKSCVLGPDSPVSYRLAILLCALVPLLLWQRSTPGVAKTEGPPAAPMAATKRPRAAPSPPLGGFADAAARGTRDSLRHWAAGLGDAEILEHLATAIAQVEQDPTRPSELQFRLRPLLCALAMEGGRRDIDGFLRSLESLGTATAEEEDPFDGTRVTFPLAGKLVLPAIAGHADVDPADAWERLRRSGPGALLEGSEIVSHVFYSWAGHDTAATMATLAEMHETGDWSLAMQAYAAAGMVRRIGPEMSVPSWLDFTGDSLAGIEFAAALAAHDPQAALARSSEPAFVDGFISRWTHADPDAALAFATAQGRPEALVAVARGLLRDDPRRAIELLDSLNDPAAARACLSSWQDAACDDDAWPVFEGAAPRVSLTTRKDAILLGLHRFPETE
jgi:hypothetical protein